MVCLTLLLVFLKFRTQGTKNLLTNADCSTNTKIILLLRQNSLKKQTFFCAAIFHPLWAKVLKSETISFPYFSPKDSKNLTSLDIELWELGAKRGLNRVYKWKEIPKKLFSPRRIYTLYEQKLSNLRQLLFITFPQGFRKSKQFGHWPLESGGKRPVNGMRK